MKIAIDAMGGDYAPASVVKAATLIKKELNNVDLVLVGDEDAIKKEFKKSWFTDVTAEIVHAPETINMSDFAVEALRKKRKSSIVIINKLLGDRKVDAVVSAGNTGAMFAASSMACGRINGVIRPAIGTFVPSRKPPTFLIDVGANINSKPANLLQFGILGSLFIKYLFNIKRPKIGLLNIGKESSKGMDSILKTYKLFEESPLNFIGNIEGGQVLSGAANVVVCDGFLGNILLKFAESVWGLFRYQIEKKLNYIPGISKIIDFFERDFDYQKYGGVPILGINCISIICHGHSSPEAIKNAVGEAKKMIEIDLINKIKEAVEQFKEENGE